jgi:threonine/homoserine/homoserine lactone efflux protein
VQTGQHGRKLPACILVLAGINQMEALLGLAPDAIAAFALTSAVIELTPGPNMAYLAIVAASEGRRPGYAAVAGVAIGLGVVGIAAALGLAAAINASPLLYQTLRWGGVGYLLWLAWDGWRGADERVEHAPLGSSLSRYFRRGLITNLLNPKAAVFYVAVLPGFVDPGGAVQLETIALSMIYVFVATAIHAGIVTLAGFARAFLEDPYRSMIARRILSLALAGIAIWFAWRS